MNLLNMTTQPNPKFRFYIIVSAATVLMSLLVISDAIKTYAKQVPDRAAAGLRTPSDREPKKDHLISTPTGFYLESDAPDVSFKKQFQYREQQVSLDSILPLYILQDGDLLANYTLARAREFVTQEQMTEAQLLTKEYDAKLKELRRQRAAVLEQAGVSIDDPQKELVTIRTKMFQIYSEARNRILNEILDAEQRKLISESQQAISQRAKEAALAAEKLKASKQ